jgi:hypothetical protein
MAKFTSGKLIKKDGFLLFVATSISVIVVFARLTSKENSYVSPQVSQKTTSPTPTQEENPIDEVSNGVYTNYKYRFRFRYPGDIFITFQNEHPQRASGKSSLEATFTDTDVSSDRYPSYTLLVFASEFRNNKNIFYENYNRQIGVPEYTSEEEKDQKLLNNKKIVEKLLIKNFPAYIDYSYIAPYASDFEPSYANHASILKDNSLLISFSVFSSGDPDRLKEERLTILKKILDSVEFFK